MIKIIGKRIENHKVLICIVKKGLATKIISSAKRAGSKGGTTAFGKGTAGKRLYENILGIPYEQEKEIVFIVVEEKDITAVLQEVIREAKLNKPGNGIGFIINITECLGVLNNINKNSKEEKKVSEDNKYNLIVTIVNKGKAEEIVKASTNAGAEGGTVINGRGSGIYENAKLLGFIIEPEKEIILILIESEKSEKVLATIRQTAKLDEVGNGIAFVLKTEQVLGIV